MAADMIVFKQEGYDGSAYDIAEYENGSRVFWYKGYYNYKTNTFTLYPKSAVVKGLKRDKVTVPARLIRRGGEGA